MTLRPRTCRRGIAVLGALRWLTVWACWFVLAASLMTRAQAQENAGDQGAVEGEGLPAVESRLAERYDRLELLAARLAELTASTQPRRAELLRQLVARGRESDVPGQFDGVVAALNDESYSTAIDGQAKLQAELQKLLELLLQEDRDRQLESERKRVLRYLQDVNKLIRLERGVKARTGGGDDAKELTEDQKRIAGETEKLQQEIAESETSQADAAEGAEGQEGQDSPGAEGGQPGDSAGEGDEKPESEQQDGKSEQSEKEPSRGDEGDSEKSPGEQKEPSESSEGGQPSESQRSEGQQSEGQPSEGQPSQGQQSEGQPSEGQPGQSGGSPQQKSPMDKASEGLKRAQQRMQAAQQQLEKAQRDGAQAAQQQAIEELEQAKADLERILRQLREEEMERMLVLLEARFRKMLEEQNAVYDETKKLDKASATAPEHELEIASGRLSRRERLIVREADRALILLREDGTSIAFPESIEQARDDMQQIAERLNRVKVDMLTQGMEEDVIAALEETLAAIQQSLEKLRDQKAQQPGGGGGEPGEQALVDQLAELRMIRALQLRINRRTQQYGALVEGEQATEAEVLNMLEELALRQAKIVQATSDLDKGNNR
jgi:hypothetical protein